MKKNTLYIGLIILCFSLYYCKENLNIEFNQNNDLFKNNLYGKVKSIEETQFYASDKFGEIKKDSIEEKKLNIYNKIGNISEHIEYNSDGSIHGKETTEYDNNGNKIEYIAYNAAGIITFKTIKTYDNKNNLTESKSYNESGNILEKLEYKYDYNGRKIEYNFKSFDIKMQNPNYKETFKYDINGNLVEKKSSGSYYDVENSYKCYKYDINGKEIEFIEYDNKGKITQKSTRIYNIKGKQIEGSYYKIDMGNSTYEQVQAYLHNKPSKHRTLYKYNDNDSIIEYIDLKENGLVERKDIFKYGMNGKRIEFIKILIDGTDTAFSTVKYNKSRDVIFNEDYNTDGSYNTKEIKKYNKNNILIEYSKYSTSYKELTDNYVYKYDDFGNLIEYIKFDKTDNEIVKDTYKYVFDNKNNWIKKTEYNNGIPAKITERVIKYY